MKKDLNDIIDELTFVRSNLFSVSTLLALTQDEMNEIYSNTLMSIENHLSRIELDLEEHLQ